MNAMPRLRVFIIDDNEVERMVLRVIIQGGDYMVIGEASGGKAGFEQVCKLQPDLVCLDVQMGDISGLDVLVQIKEAFPQTVVLMVTGRSDRETVQTALQRGANGFIIKPFNKGTVLDAIEKSVAAQRSKKLAEKQKA